MYSTLEQWNQILNVVEFSSSSDVLEQIKVELLKQNKDAYEQWELKNFNENHLCNVLLTINNSQLHCKFTLLHIAALNGRLDIVKYLVEKGADVLKKDNDGNTALDLAENSGKMDVVKFLCSTKGNKLPIITASAGLLLGLSIAYLAGTSALTPVVAAIVVFVAAAAIGALVGYSVGKVSQKLFVNPSLNILKDWRCNSNC